MVPLPSEKSSLSLYFELHLIFASTSTTCQVSLMPDLGSRRSRTKFKFCTGLQFSHTFNNKHNTFNLTYLHSYPKLTPLNSITLYLHWLSALLFICFVFLHFNLNHSLRANLSTQPDIVNCLLSPTDPGLHNLLNHATSQTTQNTLEILRP